MFKWLVDRVSGEDGKDGPTNAPLPHPLEKRLRQVELLTDQQDVELGRISAILAIALGIEGDDPFVDASLFRGEHISNTRWSARLTKLDEFIRADPSTDGAGIKPGGERINP